MMVMVTLVIVVIILTMMLTSSSTAGRHSASGTVAFQRAEIQVEMAKPLSTSTEWLHPCTTCLSLDETGADDSANEPPLPASLSSRRRLVPS